MARSSAAALLVSCVAQVSAAAPPAPAQTAERLVERLLAVDDRRPAVGDLDRLINRAMIVLDEAAPPGSAIGTLPSAFLSAQATAQRRAALRAAFELLYVKPEDLRAGLTGSEIYNIGARRLVRWFVEESAPLLRDRALLARCAEDVRARRIMPAPELPLGLGGCTKCRPVPQCALALSSAGSASHSSVVAFWARRRVDNTDALLLQYLRRALHDYDSALLALLPREQHVVADE